ncbi:MAG: hypothetical protein GY715_14630 [Planctomycetes bacterium]|nr:hypothetical protein [Planctomycetota bacterium]
MRKRTLSIIGAAGTLALAGTSSAAFTGLAVTAKTVTTTGGVDLDVFRLYVTTDSALDSVAAVGGTPTLPMVMDSGGSGFFQQTVFGAHQNVPSGAAATGAFPDLLLDSFLTIGVPAGYTGSPTLPTIQGFNFAAFNGAGTGFGSPTVTTTNGGWFVSPFVPVSAAKPYPPPNAAAPTGDGGYDIFTAPTGATHGVLVGQFSVASGNTFSGDLPQIVLFVGGNQVSAGQLFAFSTSGVGACCVTPTDCRVVTLSECNNLSGYFIGAGSSCSYRTRLVNHQGPPEQWSHMFVMVTNCPTGSGDGGPGCTTGPVKIDVWETSDPPEGGTSNCENFGAASACPIPADFFGPGSDPFTDQVCFVGDPLGTVTLPGFPEPLDFGMADTLVTRPADPFDRCSLPTLTPVVVPIQIEQLSLVSVAPITVNFSGGGSEQWDVGVKVLTSAGQPTTGSMSARKEHCNGGTFDATLAVCPTFVFTKVDPPFTELQLDFCATCNADGIVMSTSGIDWVHDQDANLDVTNPVCSDFIPGIEHLGSLPACDCNTNTVRDKCDIESGLSFDCNLNGVPDECEAPPPCLGDLSENCTVDFADILKVIAAWGPCPPECPEDLDNSGDVGFSDIMAIIDGYGPCG